MAQLTFGDLSLQQHFIPSWGIENVGVVITFHKNVFLKGNGSPNNFFGGIILLREKGMRGDILMKNFQ